MMTVEASTHGYYGRAKCGCIVMLIADMLDHPKETAKDVAAAIRSGLTIERGTVEEIRKLPFGHKCGIVTDVPINY